MRKTALKSYELSDGAPDPPKRDAYPQFGYRSSTRTPRTVACAHQRSRWMSYSGLIIGDIMELYSPTFWTN